VLSAFSGVAVTSGAGAESTSAKAWTSSVMVQLFRVPGVLHQYR